MIRKDLSEEQEESTTDLEYYTTLRVKKANAMCVCDEARAKIKEAEAALAAAAEEIAKLDEKYPTYCKEYIAQYEKGLKNVGADLQQNPLIGYMKKDIENSSSTSNAIEVFNEEEKKISIIEEQEEKVPIVPTKYDSSLQ